ncbi:MAG: fimbrillin family protein [Bacteroidales bacterium]|nr:fimbrillin family protein [Bacteroidales bacterium]
MKHVKSLLMLAAVAALTGCSTDESSSTWDAPASATGEIGFQMTTGNLSRASEADQNLEKFYKNFGVWAYKGNSTADFTTSTNLVMADYLVGYTDGTSTGYDPTGASYGAETTGLSGWWFYDNLGKNQYDGSSPYYLNTQISVMSNNATQYLKYWDANMDYTNFYAYAPYKHGASNSVVTFDPATLKMTLTEVTMSTNASDYVPYMVATNSIAKASYATTKVPLKFERVQSRLRVTVWNDIKGYDVKLLNVTPTSGSATGIVAIPADKGTSSYSLGSYVNKGIPTVTFEGVNPNQKLTVDYTSVQTATAPLSFALCCNGDVIAETRDDALLTANMSPTVFYPLPAGEITDQTNSGFAFYISYKLIAEDTQEEVIVRNAAVYVGPTYTEWKHNTAYTYVFKITDKAGPNPDPDPSNPDVPDSQLYPIIFDGIQVAGYDTEGWEWILGGDGTGTSL